MSMPAQVRKQSAAVQELYKQLQDAPETGDTNEETVDSGADETADDTSNDETQEQVSPSSSEYEQKYRTLQGMYNTEVVSVKRENAALKDRVARLEELLSSPTRTPPAVEHSKLITAKDEEEYGDTIDVIRRAAREENQALQSEIAALKAELSNITKTVVPSIEKVTRAQTESQEQIFWDRFTSAVPDWQSINNDAAFHEWLLEVDPVSGFSRQVFLEDAQRRLDVARVANLFNMWKELNNAPQAQQARDTRKSQLEKQIAPGKSRGSSRQSDKGRVYSTKDIAEFYGDIRKGVYRGRDDERARIEADIFAAQAEGRIAT